MTAHQFPPLVIGLGCVRAAGKDTLFTRLQELEPRCRRFAFADALKRDLDPFLLDRFGIGAFTSDPHNKEIIRGMLIAYGMAQRMRDEDYWVKRTIADINEAVSIEAQRSSIFAPRPLVIPIITDVRFPNEAALLRSTFPGFRLVNVTRHGAPPPTDEEEKHYRTVAALADHQFIWGNDTPEEQKAHASRLWEEMRMTKP